MAGKYAAMSRARLYAVVKAVQYVHRNELPGSVAICGVARGGCALAVARAFRNVGVLDRRIWLYDTFDGKSRHDYDDYEVSRDYVAEILEKRCPQYDQSAFVYVEGMVEDTIPQRVPDAISILHLDTDWYESTKHELIHLWPRLVAGGVVLIDDYGCWDGARRAVDEYIEENNIRLLLTPVDYTGRLGVKIGA